MSLDTDAIRKRVEAASPGPWDTDSCCVIRRCESNEEDARGHIDGGYYQMVAEGNPRNMDFIAHARQDTPALLAEVARLESEAAKREERIAVFERDYHHKDDVLREVKVQWERAEKAEQALELARASEARLRAAGQELYAWMVISLDPKKYNITERLERWAKATASPAPPDHSGESTEKEK